MAKKKAPAKPAKKVPTKPAAKPPAKRASSGDGEPPARSSDTVRVRAVRMGYYGEERRRVGDVFDMDVNLAESASWVEEVDPRTRPKRTTGKEELKKQHAETMKERAAQAGAQEGGDIEDTGGNPLGD